MKIPGWRPSSTVGTPDQKAALRRDMLARRADVTPEKASDAAASLAAALEHHPLVARTPPGPVLLPATHRTEIDTKPLARRLESTGWTIVRPRTHRHDLGVDAVPYPTGTALVPGRWGVPEPPADAASIEPHELVLIVVPGVAFDPAGHRLGMGSGVFDRFLRHRTRRAEASVIGIGYRFQLRAHVPVQSHDATMNGLQLEGESTVCVSNAGRPD